MNHSSTCAATVELASSPEIQQREPMSGSAGKLGKLRSAQHMGLALLAKAQWVGPLLVRISLAAVFVTSGWGKVNDLAKVQAFFTDLGIPAPGFHAVLVSSLELGGGVLILLGFLTRLISIPLAVTMIVALATGRKDDIEGLASAVALEEFTYFAAFVWLVVSGPGKASVDGFVSKKAG